MEKRTFLQRFQDARIELQDMELKKTGKVSFKSVNFTYYELSDFLPAINQLCKKHGLVTKFDIIPGEHEKAELSILDAEGDCNPIVFTSSTAESTSLGDGLKNYGGKTTYTRRYLLMTAFEMVESDRVEQVRKDVNDAISEEDEKLIKSAKDYKELTKICGGLKSKYKVELITPLFEDMKVELERRITNSKSRGEII